MTIKAHFDGKVFIPDEPVDLSRNQKVELSIQPLSSEKKYMTGAELVARIREDSELHKIWGEIAAGRDSVEVAQELRRKASTREHEQ